MVTSVRTPVPVVDYGPCNKVHLEFRADVIATNTHVLLSFPMSA